jgi:hypothetical protein
MSRTTALTVLTTVVVGALLWSALTGSWRKGAPSAETPRNEAPRTGQEARAMLGAAGQAPAADGRGGQTAGASPFTRLTLRIRRRGASIQAGDIVLWQLIGTTPNVARGLAARGTTDWTLTRTSSGWDGVPLLVAPVNPGAGVDVVYAAAPSGRYRLVVGLRSAGEGRVLRTPPRELLLEHVTQAVDVWLEDEPVDARLDIRVERGGRPYEGRIAYRVLRDGLPLDVRAPGAWTPAGELAVPAGVPLEVHVDRFPGMDLFPAVPPARVQLAPGEMRIVRFTLPAGRQVGIQCLSPHGERIAASLALWRIEDERHVPVDVAASLREEGDTWWGYLPPGTWFTRMGPRTDYASAGQRFDTTPGEEPMLVKVAAHATGVRVRLRLRDATGALIDAAQFNLNRIGVDMQESDFYLGRLTRGEAVSRPLSPGAYWLFLWQLGYARRVTVEADTPVVIDEQVPAPLQADAARPGVRGHVVSHVRRPLGAMRVLCRSEDGAWHYMTRTGEDGSFHFRGLGPGAYELVVPRMLLDERMRAGTRKKVLLTKATAEVTLRLPAR